MRAERAEREYGLREGEESRENRARERKMRAERGYCQSAADEGREGMGPERGR